MVGVGIQLVNFVATIYRGGVALRGLVLLFSCAHGAKFTLVVT